MKTERVKIALNGIKASLVMMLLLLCGTVFAQKADSTRFSIRPKAKAVSRIPVIKGSVQTYRPSYNLNTSANADHGKGKEGKTLNVLKIYPNPVVDQLNINLRLEKETSLSIKITDLLGNDIVTLANERIQHGEHTKTYNMPAKLNSGIYFLRIVAGGEPVIKRISVL